MFPGCRISVFIASSHTWRHGCGTDEHQGVGAAHCRLGIQHSEMATTRRPQETASNDWRPGAKTGKPQLMTPVRVGLTKACLHPETQDRDRNLTHLKNIVAASAIAVDRLADTVTTVHSERQQHDDLPTLQTASLGLGGCILSRGRQHYLRILQLHACIMR